MSNSRFDIITCIPLLGYVGEEYTHPDVMNIAIFCTSLSKLKILENYIDQSKRFKIRKTEIKALSNYRYREGRKIYPYFKNCNKGLYTLEMVNKNLYFRPSVFKISIGISICSIKGLATDVTSNTKILIDIINSWCTCENVYYLTTSTPFTMVINGEFIERRKQIFYYDENRDQVSTKDL